MNTQSEWLKTAVDQYTRPLTPYALLITGDHERVWTSSRIRSRDGAQKGPNAPTQTTELRPSL